MTGAPLYMRVSKFIIRGFLSRRKGKFPRYSKPSPAFAGEGGRYALAARDTVTRLLYGAGAT